MLSPDKKSEHIARKQEKQSKKLSDLIYREDILRRNGFVTRANDTALQITQIRGMMEIRGSK